MELKINVKIPEKYKYIEALKLTLELMFEGDCNRAIKQYCDELDKLEDSIRNGSGTEQPIGLLHSEIESASRIKE